MPAVKSKKPTTKKKIPKKSAAKKAARKKRTTKSNIDMSADFSEPAKSTPKRKSAMHDKSAPQKSNEFDFSATFADATNMIRAIQDWQESITVPDFEDDLDGAKEWCQRLEEQAQSCNKGSRERFSAARGMMNYYRNFYNRHESFVDRRGWMGIEPTASRVDDPPTALKAAEPTRRPDTPLVDR